MVNNSDNMEENSNFTADISPLRRSSRTPKKSQKVLENGIDSKVKETAKGKNYHLKKDVTASDIERSLADTIVKESQKSASKSVGGTPARRRKDLSSDDESEENEKLNKTLPQTQKFRKIKAKESKENVTKVMEPTVDKKAAFIPPEDQRPTTSKTVSSKPIQNGEMIVNEKPMEERLKELLTAKPPKKKNKTPAGKKENNKRIDLSDAGSEDKGTSSGLRKNTGMAILLTQGLHSQDKEKINNVFNKASRDVVKETIEGLPVDLVVPLIKEVYSRIRANKLLSTMLLWLQWILYTHMSYLTSVSEIQEELSILHQWLKERIKSREKLEKLQGRLHLLIEEVDAQQGSTSIALHQHTTPTLLYEDDSPEVSSDEEMGGGEEGEEDENWWREEFLSDMDEEQEESENEENEESSSSSDENDQEGESSSDDDKNSPEKKRRRGEDLGKGGLDELSDNEEEGNEMDSNNDSGEEMDI